MESENRQTRKSNLRLLFEALVVGLVTGIVVGSFRWLIGQILTMWQKGYQAAHANPLLLWLLAGGVLVSVIVAGFFVKQQPHAGGSGIPEVELQLQGKLQLAWWPILWAGKVRQSNWAQRSARGWPRASRPRRATPGSSWQPGRPAACPRPSGHLWAGPCSSLKKSFTTFPPGSG